MTQWANMTLRRGNPFSDLLSVLLISFFLLLTWMKTYGAEVCVRLTPDEACLPPPPSPFLPAPHDPCKAEWQGSGLAKWWNDDPIMRSDSKMRGIRRRLHHSLTATPSSRTRLPAAQMMIDSLEMDRRKHPLISQCFIKNIYLHLYPQLHPRPAIPNEGCYKKDNSPSSTTRQITRNIIISETSQ